MGWLGLDQRFKKFCIDLWLDSFWERDPLRVNGGSGVAQLVSEVLALRSELVNRDAVVADRDRHVRLFSASQNHAAVVLLIARSHLLFSHRLQEQCLSLSSQLHRAKLELLQASKDDALQACLFLFFLFSRPFGFLRLSVVT